MNDVSVHLTLDKNHGVYTIYEGVFIDISLLYGLSSYNSYRLA